MKRFVLIGAGLLLVLVAAIAIVPFLVPNEVYRSQIEKSASKALDRKVELSGEVGLSLLPRLSASVAGVTIANQPGFSRENMIEAGELRAVVRWMPLVSGRVEVVELIFADADVALERLETGEANWTFGAPASDTPPAEGEGEGAGQFEGGIERASLRNAALSYRDRVSGADYELRELDLTASVKALDKPLTLQAGGLFQDQPFTIDLEVESLQALMEGAATRAELAFGSDLADAGFDGGLTLGETLSLDGAFRLDARDLAGLASLAGVDPGIDLSPLERIRAEGTAAGSLDNLALGFSRLDVDSGLFDAAYQGKVTVSQSPGVEGALTFETGDLAALLTAFAIEAPGGEALSRLEFSGQLSGPVDALSVTGARLRHKGDLLDAGFDGALSMAGKGAIDGMLSARSDRLRQLLDAFDVELAPGETLESFSLEGAASGTLETVELADLSGELDEIAVSGRVGADLRGERAKLTADLATDRVDLTPFLGEGEASEGWSDEPLDLEGLRAFDADMQLKAGTLILGDVRLDDADLAAQLKAGRLTADIRSARAFGGAWSGQLGLDASGALARMELDISGSPIALSDALNVLAGLDSLTGTGDLKIDVSASGASLKALVSDLSGEMSANIADGMLKGINIGQLVRSREDIVRALADGSLQLALSPQAETDFTNLVAGLSLDGGIAELKDFRLANPLLTLEGSGQIDLGARTLDVGIVPRLDTSGQGDGSALELNGVPIPFRIRGDWLSPGLAPDTQLVQRMLREDLTNRARDEIRNEIGGDIAGSILGEILGVPAKPKVEEPASSTGEATPAGSQGEVADPPTDEPAARAATPAEPEDVIRGAAEEAARNALGGLFGNPRDDEEDESPPDTEN